MIPDLDLFFQFNYSQQPRNNFKANFLRPAMNSE